MREHDLAGPDRAPEKLRQRAQRERDPRKTRGTAAVRAAQREATCVGKLRGESTRGGFRPLTLQVRVI